MPAVIGGIASSIAIAHLKNGDLNKAAFLRTLPAISSGYRNFGKQAGFQIAYLLITISIAILSGAFVGFLVSYVSPVNEYFDDGEYWETPKRELPYFFDRRGEVEHAPAESHHFLKVDAAKMA